jgi:hypothetical protein
MEFLNSWGMMGILLVAAVVLVGVLIYVRKKNQD